MSAEESLIGCAVSHTRKHGTLSTTKLRKKHPLPCGCEAVSLEELFHNYQCQGCDEIYFYSFCLKDVVEENNTWHCKSCDTCRESSEWHCKKCNDCTFGLTLPCDRCGKKSPYA